MTRNNLFAALLIVSSHMLVGCSSDKSTQSETGLKSQAELTIPEQSSASDNYESDSSLKKAGQTQTSASYVIDNSQVH